MKETKNESIKDKKLTRSLFEEFYNINNIYEKIYCAHFCVLVAHHNANTITHHLLKSIKTLCKKQSISESLNQNLQPIIENLVYYANIRKRDFIRYFCYIYEKQLIDNEIRIPNKNLFKPFNNAYKANLGMLVKKSLEKLQIKKINTNLSLEAKKHIEDYVHSLTLRYENQQSNTTQRPSLKIIFLILVIAFIIIVYCQAPKFLHSLILTLITGVSNMALFFYFQEEHQNAFNFLTHAVEFEEKQFSLQEFRIFDFKLKSNMKNAETIVLPSWIPTIPIVHEIKKTIEDNETKFFSIKKRVRENKIIKKLTPRFLSATPPSNQFQWNIPGMPEEKIYPLRFGSFFNYSAFFNEDKFSKTSPKVTEKFITTLKKGVIVGKKGEIGVKKLKSPIIIGDNIYKWSIKIMPEPDRGLGCEAYFRINQYGQEHILIDFCHNIKMH